MEQFAAIVGRVVLVLVGLMAADIVSGLAVAWARRRVSSKVSRRGMARKVMVLILVSVGEGLEVLVGPERLGFDLSAVVAGFYCVTEAISVLENAVALGLPIPVVLKQALELASGQFGRAAPERK